jgi:hypothetical protein
MNNPSQRKFCFALRGTPGTGAARALEDDPGGLYVAISESFCRVRLAGIMVVCNPPRARHDSARAVGIRK